MMIIIMSESSRYVKLIQLTKILDGFLNYGY